MEVEDDIKQDLKPSENSVNTYGFPFKYLPISLFPDEINHYDQRDSSHTRFHASLIGMQPTKSTTQCAHIPAYP